MNKSTKKSSTKHRAVSWCDRYQKAAPSSLPLGATGTQRLPQVRASCAQAGTQLARAGWHASRALHLASARPRLSHARCARHAHLVRVRPPLSHARCVRHAHLAREAAPVACEMRVTRSSCARGWACRVHLACDRHGLARASGV